MIVLLVFVAFHAVADAAPLQPKKTRRVFFPPNLIKERLNDGDYNIEGGLFESYVEGACAQQYGQSGVCSPPCMQKWPGDNSRCIVEAKDGSCICVDPCTVLGIPRYNDFGNEIQGSGCEECVRHKNTKHFEKEPWVILDSPVNCGWCGTSCVSADANGPTVLGNDCPDNYQYTISRCRLQTLNDEDLHGIKTDEPYGGDKQKKEATGEQANKDKPVGEKVLETPKTGS